MLQRLQICNARANGGAAQRMTLMVIVHRCFLTIRDEARARLGADLVLLNRMSRPPPLLYKLRQWHVMLMLMRSVVHMMLLLDTRRRRMCLRRRSYGDHAWVCGEVLNALVLVRCDGRCQHAKGNLLVAELLSVRCLRREELIAVGVNLLTYVDLGLRRVHWALLLRERGLAGQEHLDSCRCR